jgi:hypothetical protein
MSESEQLRLNAEASTIAARPTPVKMSFSYNGSRRHPTEQYLSDAFGPDYATYFDLDFTKADESVITLLDSSRSRGERPDFFAHLIDTSSLPRDLQICPIPTVSLDIDSFGWSLSRIRWAMLFDYVFLWHPSLVPIYKAAGHPQVFALPHAADGLLFEKDTASVNRPFDLGWVGAFNYAHYNKRRRIIEGLASRFRMNDFKKRYSKMETAEVYTKSKIVVNVSREDFPQEANMRCYEAMAGGTLLITGIPTELTEWGFREGEHFIGWRTEDELPNLVDHYLLHARERNDIARSGQSMTLRDFTFQSCRDRMSSVLRERRNEFFAPARNWGPDEVGLLYLEHHYRYQLFEPAFKQFYELGNISAYWRGLPMILKTTRHYLKAFV